MKCRGQARESVVLRESQDSREAQAPRHYQTIKVRHETRGEG